MTIGRRYFALRNVLLLGSSLVTVFSPTELFAASEVGAWYDPSDLSTMSQDSAGSTPVTAVEQPVGRILDKSGRGNHATQSTTTSRPVLSARVNLLTYSEQFNNAAWNKALGTTTATITADAGTAPDGSTTADLIYPAATGIAAAVQSLTTPAASLPLTASCCFKASGIGFAYIQLNGTGGTVVATSITVNLSTGAVGTIQALAGGGITSASASVSSLGNGWYRLTLSGVLHPTNTGWAVYYGPCDAQDTRNVTASGSNGVLAWGADLRVTNAGVNLPAYQRVGASTDYDTAGFPLYLKFDGVDDFLVTGTITPGTNKAQAFVGLRKLSDAAANMILEMSTNSGSVNGVIVMNTFTDGKMYFGSKGSTYKDTPGSVSFSPVTQVIAGIADIAAPLVAIYQNGAAVSSVATTQGTGNYLAYALYIGRRGGATLPATMNLYGLIVRFGANLSDGLIASASAWINGKTKAY